jgi:hypothetical protein
MTRKQIGDEAEKLTTAQVVAIYECLERLAMRDSDGATILNDVGFNKADSYCGRALACKQGLTKREAALGAAIIRKYKRQLPADLYETIFGKGGIDVRA